MKILAIGSHLDDIELACGGTLAKAVKGGHEVLMLSMTTSEYKNFDGKVLRTSAEALNEGKEAAKIIGAKLEILNFPIKNIAYNGDTVEAIDKVITRFKPDYILTHWIHDTHQDHQNTALASISAARRHPNILMYEPFPPSGRSYDAFRPQIYSDITDTLNTKIKSLKAHKSQHKKYGQEWIEAVIGRGKMRGFESNYGYAETFELVRMDLKI
jgi:LmbE family N-acetylglucosaminyl deacetylase